MSIIQTKIFKESVETPVLKTNDIEYMGFSIPMYDVVESDFVPNDIEQSVQLNENTSSNKECNCIRILPNTNLFEKIGMMTLTGISLFSHAKQGNQNFVVLCVYAKKSGQYKFIGHSTNAFPNSNNALEMIFQFDNLKLFESIQNDGDVVYTPYREVFIKPLIVESTQYGEIISTIENPDWNDALFTTLKLRGCSTSHINFSPYVTDYDLTFGPHVKMKFKAGNYVVGDKIPHNSNGFVHLTPTEKEKVNDLYDLSLSYFNDSDTKETFIPIDTRLLDQQYNRTNGQIMCAFTIDPTEYVGKSISELRFRHAVNTDKRMVNKYLQADCYNESGALIDTFFSIEPKTQIEIATGKTTEETTFQFYNNFIIKENYKNIQFRISPSNLERANTTYYSFAGSSLRNSQTNDNDSKYRAKDGWILKWLQGAPASGTNPIAQNNLTPDFTIIFGSREIIKGSGFIKHINNNDIHFNNSQKDDLLNLISKSEDSYSPHVKNTDIHVTAEDKERWDNLTVELNAGSFIEIGENNTISVKTADSLAYDDTTVPTTKTMYLEMGYVLTDAQSYADDAVTGHRNQSGLHTSTLLQNRWNGHVDNDTIHVTQTEKDKIDAISVKTIQHNIDTRQLLSNYTDLGNESIVGFTMTVDQSYKGIVVDELDLRRNDNTNLNGNDIYIYAQCFNSNDEQINVFYSTDPDTQTSSDDKVMTWTFDDFVIPNECSSIKFYFTRVKGQKQTNVKVRTAKLLQNGTALYKDGWKTIWENEAYKTFTTDFAIRGHKTKINDIIELETLLDNHKGDDTHLTADQKNFIQTISSSFIETEQFTSKQDGMTVTEKASCKYFDISKKHFISGVSNKIKLLKKIEIPYLSGGTVYNDVHLCIQFYKNSNEQKTLDDCIFSENPQNQTNSNGLLSFEFTNVEIPEDYLFMRVYLCSDTTSIPDGTNLLRITPLKTNSLTFDDDECRVIGSNGTEYNWIVYLNAQTEEKFGYQNYKMLLQKVFDLSELVKSLQEELEELKGNLSN